MQGLQDKKYQYFGSDRMFYSGCPLNSGTAWNWVDFSGTNTGFGTHGNTECQRFALASSGTSVGQLSFNSGTSFHADIFPNDSLTFDGVNRSGCWLRSNTDSQVVRVWAW
ncbi:MAG: hypothetical protein WC444_06835 [Candidatus Paceibacterota bacterium]